MQNQRHLVHLPEGTHYLNCAFKAPLLWQSETALLKAIESEKRPMYRTVDDFFDGPKRAKHLFAQLVGCQEDEVALIPSTSYGFASALKNIKGKDGDNAVTIEGEFPSDYLSLSRWCETNEAEMKIVRPNASEASLGESWNENILNAIDEHTALVLISAVHWMNGVRFDLEAIGKKCREVNAHFIVDGTQSVGAMSMDVQRFHIDALICASYKWLFGSYSLGLAYYGDRLKAGVPLEESWMNRTNARDFTRLTQYGSEYEPAAGRYNVGESSNFILIPMLIAGLEQVLAWGPENVQTYCKTLTAPLFEFLHQRGIQTESHKAEHLFGLNLGPTVNLETLSNSLSHRNIFLSVRGQSLRVSVNVYNDANDIDALISALREVL